MITPIDEELAEWANDDRYLASCDPDPAFMAWLDGLVPSAWIAGYLEGLERRERYRRLADDVDPFGLWKLEEWRLRRDAPVRDRQSGHQSRE